MNKKTIRVITSAPEAYDSFGTKTVVKEYAKNDRHSFRLVEIAAEHYDWQTNRYLSGLHPFCDQDKESEFVGWFFELVEKSA